MKQTVKQMHHAFKEVPNGLKLVAIASVVQAIFFLVLAILLIAVSVTIFSDPDKATQSSLQAIAASGMDMSGIDLATFPVYILLFAKIMLGMGIGLVVFAALLLWFTPKLLHRKSSGKRGIVTLGVILGISGLFFFSWNNPINFIIPLVGIIVNFWIVAYLTTSRSMKMFFS